MQTDKDVITITIPRSVMVDMYYHFNQLQEAIVLNNITKDHRAQEILMYICKTIDYLEKYNNLLSIFKKNKNK